MINISNISFEDLISKTKVSLRKKTPFFSYLVEHLRIQVDTTVPTAGVTANAIMKVNPDFINGLGNDNQARAMYFEGVFVHEVMHLALKHPSRISYRRATVSGKNMRDAQLWNIACDVVVNNIAILNGFQIPQRGKVNGQDAEFIIPHNDSVSLFNGLVTINNISDKSAEEIYEELRMELKQAIKDGKVQATQSKDGFDLGDVDIPQGAGQHDDWGKKGEESEGDGDKESKKGKGKGKTEKGDFPESDGQDEGESDDPFNGKSLPDKPDDSGVNWDDVMAKAHTFAKQQGNVPAGFECEYNQIHKAQIKWNSILKKEVANSIPFDLTYSKPNKHYLWVNDMFMPSTTGEKIKVLAAIDTSGSISHTELTDFISELVGIARAWRGQVDFRILTHDVEVHDDIFISAQKGEREVRNVKLHGGGGTSHIPLYEYIEEKGYAKETKLLISFTDGYSSFPNKTKIKSIFVLAGYHCGKDQMPDWSHKVLTLEAH